MKYEIMIDGELVEVNLDEWKARERIRRNVVRELLGLPVPEKAVEVELIGIDSFIKFF